MAWAVGCGGHWWGEGWGWEGSWSTCKHACPCQITFLSHVVLIIHSLLQKLPPLCYQLFLLSHFLGLFCSLFLLLSIFPWPQCSHFSILFVDNLIHVSCFTFTIFMTATPKFLFPPSLICNSRPKLSNILIPTG